jgi:hypothetical protein
MATDLSDLSAKVTALEIVLEMLLADNLAADPDPADIGNYIVKSAIESERKVREQYGDHPHTMKVTETISSLIDRVVTRAVARRNNRGRSSPQ